MHSLDTTSAFRGKSLIGQKFGRLTVLAYAGKNIRQDAHWLCRCDCGKEKVICGSHLKTGNTTSCGCAALEWVSTMAENYLLKHGHSRARKEHELYRVYACMKQRCCDPNTEKWARYGGRGIKVCQRWLDSFQNFLDDMGPRPTPDHQIERKDNNGNYEPSNCCWATRKQQCRNRRNSRMLELNGKVATLAEWAEVTGLSRDNIKNRIDYLGWSVQAALTTPPDYNHKTYGSIDRQAATNTQWIPLVDR